MATPIMLSNKIDNLIIGKITHLEGTVTAVSADGHTRILKEGDRLFLGDVIHSSSTGESTIKLVNGAIYTMQGGSSISLNTESLKSITSQAFPETQEQTQTGQQSAHQIQYSGQLGHVSSGFTTHACGYANRSASHEQQAIGTVKCAEGFVTAIGANGSTRLLSAGDQVFAGETVRTETNSTATITNDSGSHKIDPGQSYAAGACAEYTRDGTLWWEDNTFSITFNGLSSGVSSGFGTSGSGGGNDGGSGGSSGPPLTRPLADVAISVTHTPDNSIVSGAPDPFVFTVINFGPNAVFGATIINTLPIGLFANLTVTGLPAGAQFINLNNGYFQILNFNIAAGQAIQFTLSGIADPNLRVGTDTFNDFVTISLPPSVTDPNLSNNSAGSSNNVTPQANLTLTNSDSDLTVVPGTTQTYTLTLNNSGPSNLTHVTILDTLPSGITNITASGLPQGATFTDLGNDQIEWSNIIIASGQTITLQFTGTIDPSLPEGINTFINTAQVFVPDGTTNTNGSNTAIDTNNVTPQANMTITKLVDGQTSEVVNIGDVLTYTITLGNNGPSDAININVQDLLSDVLGINFNLASATVNVGSLSTANGDLSWSISSVGVNGVNLPFAPTLSITGIVTGPIATIDNSAIVVATHSPSDNSTATVLVNADLSIIKTVSEGNSILPGAIGSVTVGADANVTFQLTAANSGGNAATNVVITDNLPSNFTLLNGTITPSVGTVSVNAGVLTWTIPSLAAGTNATLTYTENTNAPAAIEVNPNVVTITSTETNQFGDATPENNGYNGNVTVIPLQNLTITNSDGTTDVIPGTANTYTITITNDGPSALTNGSVVDFLPIGFTITSQTSSVGGTTFTDLGGGQVEWTGLNLASGATAVFTITGNIDPDLTQGTYTNIAQVFTPAGQINSNDNYTATDTDNLNPTANLSIIKTDTTNHSSGTDGVFNPVINSTTGGVAIPGSSSSESYTVVVSNTGPSNIAGITVSDIIPAGLTNVSWSTVSGGGANITSGGNSGSGNINNIVYLPSGGTITYTITGSILASTTDPLVNTAELGTPVGVTNTNAFPNSTDIVSLQPEASLTISKTDFVTDVVPGTVNTYTITVTNNGGPSDLSDVSILDTLPIGLINVSSPGLPAGVQFINYGNGVVEWTGLDLAVGQSIQLQLSGLVNPDLAPGTGTFIDSAEVNVQPGQVNTNAANNTVTDVNNVMPQVDLSISKTDGVTAVIPGTTNSYSITISNSGPSNANGVTVTDTVPTGFINLTSVLLPAGVTFTDLGNGTVEWTGLSIASGESIQLNLSGTVDPSLAAGTGSFENIITVSPAAGVTDTNSANNSYADINDVTPQVTLSITKLVDGQTSTTANLGENVVFTIEVTNVGPSYATNLQVNDLLPAGLTFVNDMVPAGTTYDSNTGVWTIGTLANGASETLVIQAQVTSIGSSVPSSIDQTATASANGATTVDSTAVVNVNADVGIDKTVSAGNVVNNPSNSVSVLAGENVTYQLTASNTGGNTANNVVITDNLPANFSLVNTSFLLNNVSIAAGDLATNGILISGNTITWNLSSLAAADNATLTYTQTANTPSIAEVNQNSATITSDETNQYGDSTPGNNTDANEVTVTPLVDLAIFKTDNVAAVIPGTPDSYTITVSNNGPSAVFGAYVIDTLPNGLINISSSSLPAGVTFTTLEDGSVQWSGLDIASGDSIQLQLSGTVDPNLAAGTNNFIDSATVNLPAGVTDANPGNNVTTDVNSVTPQVNISVVLTDSFNFTAGTYSPITNNTTGGVVIAGTTEIYQIVVSNTGPSAVSGVSVSDTFPASIAALDWSATVSGGAMITGGGYSGSGNIAGILYLPPGGYVTYTIDANIATNATGTLTNTANITVPVDVTNTNTFTSSIDTQTINTTVDNGMPQANLSIVVTDNLSSTFNASTNNSIGGEGVPGNSVTYTVVVTNSGPNGVTGATITDTLPSGISSASWTTSLAGGASITSGGASGSGDINNLADLPSGSSITYTIVGQIATSETGALINAATITPPNTIMDTNQFTQSIDIITLQPEASLTISKTDFVTDVVPGTVNTYTITVTNNGGPSDLSDVSILDTLPIGLINVSSPGLPAGVQFINYGNGVVEWTGLDLAVGQSIQLQLSGLVNPDLAPGTGTFIDSAEVNVQPGQVNTNAANNTVTDVNNVMPQVDLSISKTDGVTAVIPGTTNSYSITISNSGPSNANGVTVTDTVPTGFINLTSVLLPAGVTFTDLGNGTVEWTGLSIASGESIQLNLSGTVDPSLAAGTGSFENIITVSPAAGVTDTNSANNSYADINDVTPQVTLSITKLVDGQTSTTANLGENVVFTIEVTNVGPSYATNLQVNDLLPAGLTFVNDMVPAGTTYDSNTGVWTIGTLANGASETLVIQAQVTSIGSSVPSSIDQTATASANGATTVDSTAVVNVNADVGIDKTVSAGNVVNNPSNSVSVLAGENVTYQLTASNTGGNTANNVVITDNLPANFSLVNTSFLLNNVSIAAGDLATNGILISGNTITWNLSSLAAADNATLTYTQTANTPSIAEVNQNSATITSDETNQYGDSTPGNNTDANEVTVTPLVDLAIFKTDNVAAVIPGTPDSYTITVSNNGPSAVFDATVTDTLPTGLINVSSSSLPAGVTFTTLEDGSVQWSGLDIASGDSIQLQLSGTVDPNLAAGTNSFSNTISVSAPAGITDSNINNNTFTESNNVTPQASLSIIKLVDGQTSMIANLGQIVTYTIQVNNTGPSAATGVNVNDLLPAGLIFIGDSAPSGTTYNPNTGVWSIGTLNAGTSDTLTIVAQVTSIGSTVPSTITETATVTADDAASANSSGIISVNADVGIAKTVSAGDSVLPGAIGSVTIGASEDVTYQLTAFNQGGNTATNVVITDVLPTNFTLDNGSITPSVGTVLVNAGVLTWTIPSLAAGNNATLTYTQTANAPSTIEVNPNSVSIESDQTNQYGDSTPQNNGYTGNVTVIPIENITITNTDGTTAVIPGTANTYTITVHNGGPSALTNGSIVDILPTGFTVTGQTSSVGGVTFTNLGGGQVEWTGLNLASGATATFTLTGNIDPNLDQGTYVNIAQAYVPAGQVNTSAVYTATDTNDLNPTANLSIKVTDSGNFISGSYSPVTNDTTGGTAIPGNMTNYTIVVTNSGPSNVTGVQVTDFFPSGFNSISWSALLSSGASITSGGTSGTGDINNIVSLASGSTITYNVTANISSAAFATLHNTATLTIPVGVTDTNAFKSSTDTLALLPHGDITITNTDGLSTLSAGSLNTYNITVKNNGPSNIAGVTILDTLPAGFTNVTSPNLPNGVIFTNLHNGQVEWTILTLSSLQTLNLQLTGTLDSGLPAGTNTFTNTAQVIVPSGEVNTNSVTTATDTNNVTPIADLEILNLVNGKFEDTVTQGSIVIYTIEVTNNGAISATGVNVLDQLPTSGLGFIGNTVTTGSYNPSTGIWNLGTVASGETETLTIEAIVRDTTTTTATVTANNAASDSGSAIINEVTIFPLFMGVWDLATGQIVTNNSQNNLQLNTLNTSLNTHNSQNNADDALVMNIQDNNSCHNYQINQNQSEIANTDVLKFESILDGKEFVKQFQAKDSCTTSEVNIDALLNKMHESEQSTKSKENNTNTNTAANSSDAYAAACGSAYAANDYSSHHPLNTEQQTQQTQHNFS